MTTVAQSDKTAPPGGLTSEEAEEVTQYLVQLGALSQPLAGGLRAAAQETRSRRVAYVLSRIADGLEQGMTLDQILEDSPLLPSHISGLVVSAARAGRLGEALADLVEHHREMQEVRQGLWSIFAYPLVSAGLTAALLLVVLLGITPLFESIFIEFDLSLPWTTRLMFWFRDQGIWWMLGGALSAGVIVWILHARSSQPSIARIFAAFPLVGPLWHGLAVAEWSRVMSILLRHGVPVGNALRLAGLGQRNGVVRALSLRLASGVDRGEPLSRQVSAPSALPHAIKPLIAWGESQNMLPEALEDVGRWLGHRVRFRAAVLQSIVPPVLLLTIGTVVLFVLTGLLAPLVNLITGLSVVEALM